MRLELPVELADFLSSSTAGSENVAAYVEDLIRRDMEALDAFNEAHTEELRVAFAAPSSDTVEMNFETFMQRAKARRQ